MKSTSSLAVMALISNTSAISIEKHARAIPDGYTYNNGVLSDSIHKAHTDAETARQASVDAQEKSDAWRNGYTGNTGPVYPYGLVQAQNPADHDTYATTLNTLGDSLKERQDKYYARVLWGNESQEQSDAWRAVPWTPTQKDLGLAAMQTRAIPDGYTFNNGVLSDSIHKAHTDAETARQASVDAQEKSDVWRNGWTANTGPVYPYGLAQHRANPDGYTYNNGVLSDSILKAHTDAETARQASVDAQEKSDAWRNGFTANTGPVLSLQQKYSQNPADADTYATTVNTLGDSLKERQDKYYARVLWGNESQEQADAWRAVPYTPTQKDLGLAAMQRQAIPDGYTFNNGVLSDHIKKTHTDAETARQASVDAQEASDAWRKGSTPNSGPVIVYAQNPTDHDTYGTTVGTQADVLSAKQKVYQDKIDWGLQEQARQDEWRAVPHITKPEHWEGVASLAQGQPGPQPTDYDFHNKVLADKIATHNQIWWDEQKATVDAQSAVDAWRDGYTANTGPELPYSMSQRF